MPSMNFNLFFPDGIDNKRKNEVLSFASDCYYSFALALSVKTF